jgi:predicted MFS family arabinose efflux permease
LNNTLIGVAAAVTPLIGAWLANTKGYQALFVVTIIVGLAGFILLRWTVREPREVS